MEDRGNLEAFPVSAWAEPAPVTVLREDILRLHQVPTDLEGLVAMVQGLLLNVFWAEEHGVEISEQRLDEVELRTATRMLERILELDSRSLQHERLPDKRLVSNARSFAVLTTALLRAQGFPARVRCGFSTYFKPGLYLEHWLCEVWQASENRWVLVDAQLDPIQKDLFGISFPAVDVPRVQFLTAGQAWQLCWGDEEDPEDLMDPDLFGLYGYTGMWFIRGSLVRDVLALAKIELLPWDSFGLIGKDEEQLTDEDLALLDELAELSQEEISFPDVLSVLEQNPSLQAPEPMR
jgi:hypothetical protein